MEQFFKFKEHGTDVKTEVIAGVTTFMTMAYILAVNPSCWARKAPGWIQGQYLLRRLWLQPCLILIGAVCNLPLCCLPVWD